MNAQPTPSPSLPQDVGESQWSIVARMFRRRRTAVWGLKGTYALVLVAIFAPVLCSGLPFVWREPGGALEFPWFRRIFDNNYWTNGVDRFFNLLMPLVTLWLLFRGLLWVGGRVARSLDSAEKRKHVRGALLPWYLGVGLVLVVAQMAGLDHIGYKSVRIPLGFLSSSEAYQDYRGKAREFEAAGEDFTAVFAPIPYGHRESLPGADDRYLNVMDFGRGERHVLGTDKVGRDVFSRLLYGTRISLTVGLVAVGIYVTIGTILGALAGFNGGRIDLLIMRVVEIVICVPGLFLILTIIALFGEPSIFKVMLAIGLVAWTGIARLVRGEFIRERSRDYVAAARSLGLSSRRILFRHVLPNAIAPVIVAATFGVAGAIITESTLSFLGLGDPSVPSWGMILNEGREDVEWHMILSPGVAIFITVTLLNLVGDGLRDALDPKLRQ